MFKHTNPSELESGPCLHTARTEDAEPFLICATCGHRITSPDQAIQVNGSHKHICTNPESITFRIGCFATAAGCVQYGPATIQHTWFTGYAWQVALCGKCRSHLGWRFANADRSFYGLISARLTHNTPGPSG